jgi:immunoglobulin superfamily protein 8
MALPLNQALFSLPALDTLFVPLLVGTGVALVTGASVLATITCCFMKRLRKR